MVIENTPKKVRVHSELERDNHINQDELDLQKDIIEANHSNGRPQLKENELRTKYVKVYCTEEEKKQIYKNYSSSAVMREHLLKPVNQDELDLQKDIIEANHSNGRPQLKENELRTKYVKIYCTEDEKKIIYKNYSSSAVMREHLLKPVKDGER